MEKLICNEFDSLFNNYDNFDEKTLDFINDIDAMVISNTYKYSLMSKEEEYIQGKILCTYKEKIKIMVKENNKYSLYPNLNLEKIFLSINKKEDLKNIELIKKIPYLIGDESIFKDQIEDLNYFLKISSNEILTKEQLIISFPNLNFDKVVPVDNLEEQALLLKDYLLAKFNFFVKNMRLVIFVAKNLGKGKLTLADKIQEGNMGLINAINKYEYSKARFSTYATYFIAQAIDYAIARKDDLIIKPVEKRTLIRKLEKYVNDYINYYGENPSTSEIAKYLEVSEEVINKLYNWSNNVVSLDVVYYNLDKTESINRLDFSALNSEDEKQFDDEIILSMYVKDVLKQMDFCLTEREKNILLSRVGLNEENKIYTLEELHIIYGLTRERIRQIEEEACKKIYKKLKLKQMID